MDKKSKFCELPDYLIENYIIPYVGTEELFYKVRPVSTECYNNSKNTLQVNFPEEMINRLKEICNLNKEEDLAKQFNDRSNKLLNDRNMLFIYSLQLNFADIIKKVLEANQDDEKVLDLIRLFFTITKSYLKLQMINNGNFEELKMALSTEESIVDLKSKIEDILNTDLFDYNINDYVRIFTSFDENYLKGISDLCSVLYVFSGKLIEFQIQKINHKQLKQKLDNFFAKITKTSDIWPVKRNFYEKSMALVEKSKTTNKRTQQLLNLFEKYEIETPLNDYLIEKKDVCTKEEAFPIIVENRDLLTEKIERLEKMVKFYYECKIDDNPTSIYDTKFEVDNEKFSLPDFLVILSMIKPKLDITKSTFKLTQKLIKKYKYDLK